jgi:hypothetical protein
MSAARAVRGAAAAAVLVLTGSGCAAHSGGGSASLSVSADNIAALADRVHSAAHTFSDRLTVAGHTWTVTGAVEDDFRYQASVSLDGRDVYDEVDLDDARWVRVPDPEALFDGAQLSRIRAAGADATALLSGAWVTDPNGAPGDLTAPDASVVPLDPSLVLDAVHAPDAELLHRLRGHVKAYNRDAIDYLPRNDKFPAYPQDGRRFDRVPPGSFDVLHPPSTLSALRDDYEFDSVWAKPDGVTRIERLLALPDPHKPANRAVYTAVRTAGSVRLEALVQAGASGVPMTETLTFKRSPVTVQAPAGARRVDLMVALHAVKQAVGTTTSDPAPVFGPVG